MQSLAQRYVAAIESGNTGLRCRLERELDAETAAAAAEREARYNAPDAMLKVALWYARRGIAVFPCEYKGKRPLTNNGLHDATTDEAKIVEWWRRTPLANIGAPTGITFDVIDIDGPEAVAVCYLDAEPVTIGGRKLKDIEIGHVLTTRPGGHHVYIQPSGRGNATNIFPHVDFRGKGGYVIVPPSLGGNGRRYEWTAPLNLDTTRKAAA